MMRQTQRQVAVERAKRATALLGPRLVSIVASWLIVRQAASNLSLQDFGKWVTLIAVAPIIAMGDLGMNYSLVRTLAIEHSRHGISRGTMTAVRRIALQRSLLVSLAVLVAYTMLLACGAIPDTSSPTSGLLALLGCLPLTAWSITNTRALQASGSYLALGITQSAGWGLATVGAWWGFGRTHYLWPGIGVLAQPALSGILAMPLLKTRAEASSWRRFPISLYTTKEERGYLLTSVSEYSSMQADPIIVAALIGFAGAAALGAATRAVAVTTMTIASLNLPLLTDCTVLASAGDRGSLRARLRDASVMVMLGFAVQLAFLLALRLPASDLLFNGKVELDPTLLVVVTLAQCVGGLKGVAAAGLNALGDVAWQGRVALCVALLNTAATFTLTATLGSKGPACATFFSVGFVALPLFVRRLRVKVATI